MGAWLVSFPGMLVMKKVSHTYPGGAREALRGVDLRVGAGEVVGIVGGEGAGKSTVVRIFGGLIRTYAGDVEFEGRELKEWSREYFEAVGVCLERPGFFSVLSAAENLQYFARLHAGEMEPVPELLEKVGLEPGDRRRVERFSEAERKCLGLARALLHKPRALFLDDPLEGLEAARADRIRELLRARAAAGSAVIFVTGNRKFAEGLAGRMAVLEAGRLTEGGGGETGRAGGGGA